MYPEDQIPPNNQQFTNDISNSLGNPFDLHIETCLDSQVTILYLKSIVNQTDLQDHLLTPINRLAIDTEDLSRKNPLSWDNLLPLISETGRFQRQSMESALNDIISGRVIIHLESNQSVYSFDARKVAKRQPTEPQVERAIRAPRISFIEALDDNLSLIRDGIKDIRLRVDEATIGTRTKTRVVVIYLHDIAMSEIVQEVHRRLNAFEIDGILDSGYIEQLISDNRWSIFPLVQSTERPDKVKSGILEGRIAILVDGSSQALIVPTTVNELYQSPEDYYFGFWFGSFMRGFRILGNNIAVALPGLYVALVGINNSLLPIQFTLSVAGSRLGVATPLIIEILIME
ncbi:MAG TPA: spore germination protein, partial [Bacillota bacterium]|nr:spore germination protein [Bacillota bacterium]